MTRSRWAFVPSPDGKRVVFYFGLNKLWIIDSTGESFVKISLPFAKSDNWVVKAIADYFAHTLAVSVVDSTSVPILASLWMSSFISLLP